MLIKEAKYKKVKVLQRRLVSPEVHGCDECRTVIENWPNEVSRLDLTVFYQNNEADHLHFCSWGCVLKHVPKIKTDYFFSLPNVIIDSTGKKSSSEFIKLCKRLLTPSNLTK